MSQAIYRGVLHTIQNDTQSVPQTILTYRGVDYRPNTEINQPSGGAPIVVSLTKLGVNLEVDMFVRTSMAERSSWSTKISGHGDWSLIVCEGRGYTLLF